MTAPSPSRDSTVSQLNDKYFSSSLMKYFLGSRDQWHDVADVPTPGLPWHLVSDSHAAPTQVSRPGDAEEQEPVW